MTPRRRLLIALGAGLAWPPLKAFAQQAGNLPVVCILALDAEGRAARLRESLARLRYAEGRNFRLIVKNVDERYAQLRTITDELVRLKPDVIVAIGNTSAVALSKATSTIPIVMVSGADPVQEKLAVSLSRPGRNVTGVTTITQEMVPKRLQLVNEAIADLARVGILWYPDSRGSTNSLAQTRDAASKLKMQLQVVEVRSADDFDKAFDTLAKSRTRIFVVMPAGMFEANRGRLLEAAAKHRLAGVYASGHWCDGGGLIAYGPNQFEAERHAAVFVDKILKGAKPGDLPIEQPTKLELVVNLKTAKALGIRISQSILVRADRLIE